MLDACVASGGNVLLHLLGPLALQGNDPSGLVPAVLDVLLLGGGETSKSVRAAVCEAVLVALIPLLRDTTEDKVLRALGRCVYEYASREAGPREAFAAAGGHAALVSQFTRLASRVETPTGEHTEAAVVQLSNAVNSALWASPSLRTAFALPEKGVDALCRLLRVVTGKSCTMTGALACTLTSLFQAPTICDHMAELGGVFDIVSALLDTPLTSYDRCKRLLQACDVLCKQEASARQFVECGGVAAVFAVLADTVAPTAAVHPKALTSSPHPPSSAPVHVVAFEGDRAVQAVLCLASAAKTLPRHTAWAVMGCDRDFAVLFAVILAPSAAALRVPEKNFKAAKSAACDVLASAVLVTPRCHEWVTRGARLAEIAAAEVAGSGDHLLQVIRSAQVAPLASGSGDSSGVSDGARAAGPARVSTGPLVAALSSLKRRLGMPEGGVTSVENVRAKTFTEEEKNGVKSVSVTLCGLLKDAAPASLAPPSESGNPMLAAFLREGGADVLLFGLQACAVSRRAGAAMLELVQAVTRAGGVNVHRGTSVHCVAVDYILVLLEEQKEYVSVARVSETLALMCQSCSACCERFASGPGLCMLLTLATESVGGKHGTVSAVAHLVGAACAGSLTARRAVWEDASTSQQLHALLMLLSVDNTATPGVLVSIVECLAEAAKGVGEGAAPAAWEDTGGAALVVGIVSTFQHLDSIAERMCIAAAVLAGASPAVALSLVDAGAVPLAVKFVKLHARGSTLPAALALLETLRRCAVTRGAVEAGLAALVGELLEASATRAQAAAALPDGVDEAPADALLRQLVGVGMAAGGACSLGVGEGTEEARGMEEGHSDEDGTTVRELLARLSVKTALFP